jgi:hypothetical protein
MTAIQFDAEVRKGMLALPSEARSAAFEGPVHVILVKGESELRNDFISELLVSPAEVSDFVHLTRDQANEREG